MTTNSTSFWDTKVTVFKKQDQFFKLEKGDNKFRFIGEPLPCWILFVYDREAQKEIPLRKKFDNKLKFQGSFSPEEIADFDFSDRQKAQKGFNEPKFTLISCIYVYSSDCFKILEISQKSILENLRAFTENEEYGNPTGYDITVSKAESTKFAEFKVIASPPKPLNPQILERSKNLDYDLRRVLEGEYPANRFPFEEIDISKACFGGEEIDLDSEPWNK